MKVLFRSVDIETTGFEPPEEIIEIGWTDVVFDTETKGCEISAPQSRLFKNTRPITPENRAVHHITDAELADKLVCTEAHLREVCTEGAPAFFVAHNAEFEARWFTPDIRGEMHLICTYKTALRVYEEASTHSNQGLRYYLGLGLDADLASPPHCGGPDSYVTAFILADMLKTTRASHMAGWTIGPRYYATCPLTKHKGLKWCDVPHDFLNWMANKPNDLDADLKQVAREEMERRRGS
jgi:exodeoxyribonuclease X